MTEVPAAPLDRLTRVVTIVTVVLFVGLAAALVAVRSEVLPLRIGIAALFVTVAVVSWAFAPRGYALGDGQLVVRRRGAGPRAYALGPEPPVLWPAGVRGIRLWGSGGFFGHYGLFRSKELGSFRAHVTDRRRTVLVRTRQGPVVISPTDPEALLTQWRPA